MIAAVPDLRKTDSEGEEGEGAEQGGGTEGAEEGKEESEDKSDDQSSSSDSEGEDQKETPDTSDDEQPENVAHKTDSGANVEGVQFKGATSGGSREGEQGDTRLHIPDAKGGNKKRISSDYGNRQGVAQDDDSKAGTTTDKVRGLTHIYKQSERLLIHHSRPPLKRLAIERQRLASRKDCPTRTPNTLQT